MLPPTPPTYSPLKTDLYRSYFHFSKTWKNCKTETDLCGCEWYGRIDKDTLELVFYFFLHTLLIGMCCLNSNLKFGQFTTTFKRKDFIPSLRDFLSGVWELFTKMLTVWKKKFQMKIRIDLIESLDHSFCEMCDFEWGAGVTTTSRQILLSRVNGYPASIPGSKVV